MPGDAHAQVQALNDVGLVVGLSQSASYASRGVIWTRGVPVELPPLPGGSWTWPMGINNRGVVVGSSGQGNTARAVTWSNGVAKAVGSPAFTANAINDRGDVVGDVNGQAAIVARGVETILNLQPAGYLSTATAINNRGEILGYSQFSDGGIKIWQWAAGKTFYPPLAEGAHYDLHSGINDRGQFVWTDRDDQKQLSTSFSASRGHVTGIDPGAKSTGCEAIDITNDGRIVGVIFYGSGYEPVVWKGTSVVTIASMLPAQDGWYGLFPQAINNRGQILGEGFQGNRRVQVLLTP